MKSTFPATRVNPNHRPAISVIICAWNPRPRIFGRTLDSIASQTLAADEFELIVVDNNSQNPLDAEWIRGERSFSPLLLSESRQGLGFARCTGIAAASADLMVFVDDDNFLDPHYLENVLRLAESEPKIGLFGGISQAELEHPIPRWKSALLPYLGVQNYGPEPITVFADQWGKWEPIGAGMAARREVAEKFVQMYRSLPPDQLLGRSGAELFSGDDALFARAAYRTGYCCSYQPRLRLTHYLKRSRFEFKYLTRLMLGHGRSYVRLHRALGKPTAPLKMRTAVARLLHRVLRDRFAGLITWFWDIGYALEKQSEPDNGHVEANTEITSAEYSA
jgi:glycosyltransferase involved in cell wall biosynthesis